MGLFSISPVQRFLEGTDGQQVYSGTRLLLSGFLRAMQAENIWLQYGKNPLLRELMGAFESETFGANAIPLSKIGDDEETGARDRSVEQLHIEAAVERCAIRMANLKEIPKVSRGISFGINARPESPKTSWSVVLHRGPLPLLQIQLSDVTGFHPPTRFVDSVVRSQCSHLMCGKSGACSGGGDHLYLQLKRREMFPYSRGSSDSKAVEAGQRLRGLCREVWQEWNGDAERRFVMSSWTWKRKRFVRRFDNLLIQSAGAENVDTLLRTMGTNLEQWAYACT